MSKERDLPGLIHIHAQTFQHEPAHIVANRKGLEMLIQAAQQALDSGKGQVEVMPSDGECFDLVLIMDDSDWQSPSWRSAAMPYTDEMASEKEPDALWPWNRGENRETT